MESCKRKQHHLSRGTIHPLRAQDFPLPAEYEQAYSASDRLVFETDISAMNTPQSQISLLNRMTADPGKRLSQLLSATTYQAFAAAFTERGLNIRMVEPFKVSMATFTLQVAEFTRMGLSPEGVDMYFFKRALQHQLATAYLESFEQHYGFMVDLGAGWEEEFIKPTLRIVYDEMSAAWRKGDLIKLEQLFIEELRLEYPDAFEQMLAQRNRNWLPQLEQMFTTPGTEFVLVGVAHMVGQDGLLHQLAIRGYRVSQL